MIEKRKHPRFKSLGRATINALDYGECLVKDVGVTGCSIESTMYMDIKPGVQYKITIIPEGASGVGEFELLTEAKWVRAGDYSCEAGFFVVESPRGKLFQRYVDYLAWRSSVGKDTPAV